MKLNLTSLTLQILPLIFEQEVSAGKVRIYGSQIERRLLMFQSRQFTRLYKQNLQNHPKTHQTCKQGQLIILNELFSNPPTQCVDRQWMTMASPIVGKYQETLFLLPRGVSRNAYLMETGQTFVQVTAIYDTCMLSVITKVRCVYRS